MNQGHLFRIRNNKGRWTEEESKRFDDAYAIYGKNWKMITRAVGTRSIIQVRSHAQKILPRLATPPPAPIDSSESQPPSQSPSNPAPEEPTENPERKNSERRFPNSLIPPNLYGVWAYHTLKAAECFQMIQSQNNSGQSVSRSRTESQHEGDREGGNEPDGRDSLQGIG